jgi:hypothetical protein
MKSKYAGILATMASASIVIALGGFASFASAAAGGPTVTLSSTSTVMTHSSPIPITATFSGPVTGVGLSGIDTTNGTASNPSGTGAVYTFNITPSTQGTTTVMIPADIASSTSAGNAGNQASNTLSFGFDTIAPTIAQVTGIASTTSSATPSFTFSSTEAGAIGLIGGCTSATSMAAAGNNTLTFNALSNGTYDCSLSVMDAAGNTSNILPIDFNVNAASSTTGTTTPVISSVAVSVTGSTTATITWNTDVNSSSQVFYGPSASYNAMTILNPTAVTSHTVFLGGLVDGSLYHFDVTSGNTGGMATSSDMTFTAGTGSTSTTSTPLAVTGISTIQGNATADGTFADGWQWVLHFTVPTNESFFSMKFGDFTNGSSGTIPAKNDILFYSPQSSNASTQGTGLTETDNNYTQILDLNGDTSTSTAGRQIDIFVNVAVPSGTPIGTYSTTFGALSTTTATTTP